jgi:hypothetical protein
MFCINILARMGVRVFFFACIGVGVLEHDNMGVGVLHLTCVQIFIIFLFLGGILVEEESYILHVRSRMIEDSYSIS